MADISEQNAEYNQMVLEGKALEAFEKYAADDIVMMENDEAFEGKDVNRQREIDFFSRVKEIHSYTIPHSACGDDVSFCVQEVDMTMADGSRMKMDEVSVRYWKDGKIVKERFFYKAMG